MNDYEFLKQRLSDQLNDLSDNEASKFFNSYDTLEICLFADIECKQQFVFKNFQRDTIYYNGDGLTQYSIYQFSYQGSC